MKKRQRPSRAKKLTDADLRRVERSLATVPEQDFESWSEALRKGRTADMTGNPYAEWIRPKVDREALLRAVHHPEFNFILNRELSRETIDLDTAGRWRRLCLILAAKRELIEMEGELGEVEPSPRDDDPRNETPITKEVLFRLAKRRDPKNTAEVSRWFAQEAFRYIDPSISSPGSRVRFTLNLRLFAERFGVPIKAVVKALP